MGRRQAVAAASSANLVILFASANRFVNHPRGNLNHFLKFLRPQCLWLTNPQFQTFRRHGPLPLVRRILLCRKERQTFDTRFLHRIDNLNEAWA